MHDPRSEEIVRALAEIDFEFFDDHFCWKVGGDGDNGEALMYELDEYFLQKAGSPDSLRRQRLRLENNSH
jgi:hypothetical protein